MQSKHDVIGIGPINLSMDFSKIETNSIYLSDTFFGGGLTISPDPTE